MHLCHAKHDPLMAGVDNATIFFSQGLHLWSVQVLGYWVLPGANLLSAKLRNVYVDVDFDQQVS
jgi:hypothetical protein